MALYKCFYSRLLTFLWWLGLKSSAAEMLGLPFDEVRVTSYSPFGPFSLFRLQNIASYLSKPIFTYQAASEFVVPVRVTPFEYEDL